MTQELQRDDSLPYREFFVRPGEALDFGFEWGTWLANRWFAGVPVSAGYTIRPRKANGFEYVATAGHSGVVNAPALEPAWPTVIGYSVQDGSVVWTCQAISNASLISTISSQTWVADATLSTGGNSLSGTKTSTVVTVPTNLIDGDYYVRNTITLANGVKKVGTLLMRVRANQV